MIERLYPIFVTLSRDITGGSTGDPPCFGSKGGSFAQTHSGIYLTDRPFMALLLRAGGDALTGHGYLGGSD